MLAVAFIVPASAMAWTTPSVTPLCAPDDGHFAFTVNLDQNIWDDTGYKYDWAFGTTKPKTGWTTVEGTIGDNSLVTPRGEGKLWVRWTMDHNSYTSAVPDGTLCVQPSEEPSVEPSECPSEEPSVEPSESASVEPSVEPSEEPSVEPSESASVEPSESASVEPSESAEPTPTGSVAGATGVPHITMPATDATGGPSSGSAGAGLQLLLLAAAGVLIAALLLTPRRAGSRR